MLSKQLDFPMKKNLIGLEKRRQITYEEVLANERKK
jgi:hypothetical protein